jgi:superfamily II DNA/RNA helicase
MESFRELGLKKEIVEAVERKGFTKPTTIQQKTIPLILEGRDVLAGSKTGSGKTFAFGAGLIQKLTKQRAPFALVLVPTRELAEQVSKEIQSYTNSNQVFVTPIYGGVSMNPQVEKLRKTNIIVATPGRLLDHDRSGTVNLSEIQMLVLDEADRMLDMGFIDDIEQILKQTPKSRQTLLYTATLRPELLRIAAKYMNHPEEIQVEQHVSQDKLKQVYYDVRNNTKISLLVHLLKNEDSELSMIFCNTRHQVDLVANILKENGVKALALHGGLTQNRRNQVMKQFDDAKTSVLVCTDVSARGIHVDNVSHVYNYDIPRDPKEYTHRIGRTARAETEGLVINILTPNDHGNFGRIQHEYRNFKLQKEELPQFPKLMVNLRSESREEKKSFGPRGFKDTKRRPSKSGFKPRFSDREERSSDRPPRRSSEGGFSSDRKPSSRPKSSEGGYSDRKPSSDSRPRSREGGYSDRRPSSDSRPRSRGGGFSSDRKPSSDSRPRSSEGGYSDRKPSSDSRPRSREGGFSSDRKPSSRPKSSEGGYSDRKPSSGKKFGSAKKKFDRK